MLSEITFSISVDRLLGIQKKLLEKSSSENAKHELKKVTEMQEKIKDGSIESYQELCRRSMRFLLECKIAFEFEKDFSVDIFKNVFSNIAVDQRNDLY